MDRRREKEERVRRWREEGEKETEVRPSRGDARREGGEVGERREKMWTREEGRWMERMREELGDQMRDEMGEVGTEKVTCTCSVDVERTRMTVPSV